MAPQLSNLRRAVGYLVAIAFSVVLASPGNAVARVIQASILEQESPGGNTFTVYMPREVSFPERLSVTPPSGTPAPTYERGIGSYWEVTGLDEALDLLAGDWELQIQPFPLPPPLPQEEGRDKFLLTIDPLSVPTNARMAGPTFLPPDGTRLRQDESFFVEAHFVNQPDAGTPLVFTSIQTDDLEFPYNIGPPQFGYVSASLTLGSPTSGKMLRLSSTISESNDVINAEQSYVSLGYSLPAEITLAAGSHTALGTFEPVWIEGESPMPLDLTLEVAYRFRSSQSVTLYLVPEPTSASLIAFTAVGILVTGWRKRTGRVG